MTELAIKKRQNVYRRPSDIYDRKYDKQISEEEVRKALVGEKLKEIIEDDKNKLKQEREE